MDMTVEEAVSRLQRKRGYRKQFRKAFGREITGEDLARALASYVRTILSGDSPFDRYLYGDREALSEEAQEGLRLFRGKANCSACHVGPNLTDEQFHNTGVAWRDGRLLDEGRFAVTGKPENRGAFKTPILREVGRTAPYMHTAASPRCRTSSSSTTTAAAATPTSTKRSGLFGSRTRKKPR